MKHALLMMLLRIIGSKKVMRRLTTCVSSAPGRSEVLFIMLLRNLTKLNFYAERELAIEEDYWDFLAHLICVTREKDLYERWDI